MSPIIGSFASGGGFGRRGGKAAELYEFTSATFSTGGQTGRIGPSLTQARNGLTGPEVNTWKTDTTFFNTSDGIQLWTVPADGLYTVGCRGAQGGQSTCWGRQGGLGATMIGTFTLNKGDVLKLLVGQMGGNICHDGAGGGGTFVTKQDNTPLIIAAGGGGASASGFSGAGQIGGRTDQSGSNTSWGTGGSNGNGGTGSTAGGGGGLNGNGSGSWFGQSFVNGGLGGAGQALGGFGGGGGSGGTNGAGGGGGYSGGSYAPWSWDAGGGGSINNGTNQQNTNANNSNNGFITIQRIQ